MSSLTKTTRRLVAAYDRLLATYQVNTAAEFTDYCARYDVDHESALDVARRELDSYRAFVRDASRRVTLDDFQ